MKTNNLNGCVNHAKRARFGVFLIGILAMGAAVAQAPASNYPYQSETSDDLGTATVLGNAFGASADTWGDWLFVGAPRETTLRDGFDQQDGAVYIYAKDPDAVQQWYYFQEKLTRPGNSGLGMGTEPYGDRFGSGIAAAGGWLFVAAVNDQDFPGLIDPRQGLIHPDDPAFQFAGKVHVYSLNDRTWEFRQTLTPPAPGTNGSFGSRTQASHIALDSKGEVAIIGELNNFTGGVGQLHVYVLKKGSWKYKYSIGAPFPEIDTFGDDLVFASDQYLIAGGSDTSDGGLTSQGFIFVFAAKDAKKPGKFYEFPVQTIAGPVVATADCPANRGFGRDGLDAAGGVVVVADPCVSVAAGDFAGAAMVYRVIAGPAPLVLDAIIDGNDENLYSGANFWGSRNAVAVSDSGERILIGSPLSPNGSLGSGGWVGDGVDVRVFRYLEGVWTEKVNLTTPTEPGLGYARGFGDTVFFASDVTALARQNNVRLVRVSQQWKGAVLFYSLLP
jgi:hypothetical protein